MRRSDGLVAIGLGTCIHTQNFIGGCKTKPGDRFILYAYPAIPLNDPSLSVQGPEKCTWGQLGDHYQIDYWFSEEHRGNPETIQQAIEVNYEW